jgi:cysteine synthase A
MDPHKTKTQITRQLDKLEFATTIARRSVDIRQKHQATASSNLNPIAPVGASDLELQKLKGLQGYKGFLCMTTDQPASGKGTSIMNELPPDILHCIGNTSLLALRNIVPKNGARILLKLESENPTGSMKDRMALAMIEAAEADGRLKADGTIVEYTGGSTGVSLSLICAVKRYSLHIVTSDAFAREKLDHMKILGAKLQIVHSESGGMTEKLTRDMIEAARVITEKTGGFWTDQLNNKDQIAAYHKMAEEIWIQTNGQVDGFVQMVGTAASLRGTGEALRRHNKQIRIVAVEPSESPVLSGGQPGSHKIDGVGAGFVVPLWRDDIADQIEHVSTEEAMAMAMRLAREEGLFAGTSTGGNVIAALRLAEQLGPDATIVTVMCDTGMKYLSK